MLAYLDCDQNAGKFGKGKIVGVEQLGGFTGKSFLGFLILIFSVFVIGFALFLCFSTI